MSFPRALALAAGVTFLTLGSAACSPAPSHEQPDTMDSSYTITQATSDMEAALADIRRVFEGELGTEGWSSTEGFTTQCSDDGTARYWGEIWKNDRIVPADRWPGLWESVVAAASRYGYTDPSEDPAQGDEDAPSGDHFIRLSDNLGGTLTFATIAGAGTTFRGETICLPGYSEDPADR